MANAREGSTQEHDCARVAGNHHIDGDGGQGKLQSSHSYSRIIQKLQIRGASIIP